MKSIGGFCIGRTNGQAFVIDDVCCHSQARCIINERVTACITSTLMLCDVVAACSCDTWLRLGVTCGV